MTSLQKQTSSTTFVNDNNDLNKLKNSLSQRAMARRSVCINSTLLAASFSQQEGSKEEPIKVIKSPLKDKDGNSTTNNNNNNNNSTTTSTTTTTTMTTKIPERPNIKPGFRTNTTSSSLKSKDSSKDNSNSSGNGASTTTTTTTTTTTSSSSTITPKTNESKELNINNVLSSGSLTPKRSGTLRGNLSTTTTGNNNNSNNSNTNNSNNNNNGNNNTNNADEIHIKHTASSLQKMKTLTMDSTRTKRSNTISSGIFSKPTGSTLSKHSSVAISDNLNNDKEKTTTTPSTSSSSSTANDNNNSNNNSETTSSAADTPKPKPKEDVFTRLSSSITKSSRSRSLSVSANIANSTSTSTTNLHETQKDSSKISKILPKILRKKDPSTSSTTNDKSTVKEPKDTLKSKTSPIKSSTSPIKSSSSSTSISTLSDSTASISLTSSSATSPTKSLSNYKCTMTPNVALKLYINDLTLAEQSEILNFSHIYFTGNTTQKVKFNKNLPNNGFDNENGDYKIVEHDHIAYRYEIISSLGHGSFCQVAKCHDHKTGQLVALKILKNQKRFHAQAMTEIKILEYLKNNDPNSSANIVHMNDSFEFRNHFCITFELLSMNLYDFLKNNQFHGFNISLIKRFAAQLLTSLRFLSKRHIIHADLKPENILLKQPTKSGIKLIDFGSSCFENEQIFTYIQSRFYRSPEVILGIKYDKAIDIWSLGCILAELYTGYPLFPGNDESQQLACIIEVFGVPPLSIIRASTRRDVFFEDDNSLKPVFDANGNQYGVSTKGLVDFLGSEDMDFVDFIEQCLQWEPSKRITPEEGLRHRWISDLTTSSTPTPTTSNNSAKEES